MTAVNGHKTGRVLVTGGAGFIGSHIALGLHTLGWQTQVLDSLAAGNSGNVPPGVPLHSLDVRSEPGCRALIREERFDAIVHCAAQTSVERSMVDPEGDREVNVTGTRILLAAARDAGVQRFVFISSGGAIYGDMDEPATESTLPAPRSYYGLHKYVAEEFVRESGLPYAILRPSNVYGQGQRSDVEGGVLSIFFDRLNAGLPIDIHGTGGQVRDFVYVEDVVDAVRLGLQTTTPETWNVSTGAATTIIEAARLVATIVGRQPELRFGPSRAGDVEKSLLSPDRLLATGAWGPPIGLEAGLRRLGSLDAAATAKH